MNRIFTRNILQVLKKVFLVVAFACAISATQSYTTFNNSGFGQVKIVKCYPNPAISYVNFELFDNAKISKNYTLEVYSFTGKKMYSATISSEKITLTLTNDFYRGIYVYQVLDKAGRILETGKFQVDK
ncbi:MAG TPA: T9SS type A sorting domain-containing protein [Parafilimonas sp.]|nr:T9SS type A sorting domain-containing protein [Parafilimonas sp.]